MFIITATIVSIIAVAQGGTPVPSSCSVIPWLYSCEGGQYDKFLAPQLAATGDPTNLTVAIYVENVYKDVAEGGKKDAPWYWFDFYLVQTWDDTRLAHNYGRTLVYISYDCLEYLDKIWHPDLYIASAVDTVVTPSTIPQAMFKIQPNGQVRSNNRVKVKLYCPGDVCTLKIVSYANFRDVLNAQWTDPDAGGWPPIQFDDKFSQTDYTIATSSSTLCDGTAYVGLDYNCLLATFTMKPVRKQTNSQCSKESSEKK